MANETYVKVLARADKLGVKIVGRGRWTSGAAFFLVSSATTSKPHIVTVGEDGSETCDCPSRQLCTHRAVARRQLAADAAETARWIEQTRQSMEQSRETSATLARVSASLDAADAREAARKAEAAKRETAMLASRASNKPFSIWAS